MSHTADHLESDGPLQQYILSFPHPHLGMQTCPTAWGVMDPPQVSFQPINELVGLILKWEALL